MDKGRDMDLVVGNLGLNYKYKGSTGSLFQVHNCNFWKHISIWFRD